MARYYRMEYGAEATSFHYSLDEAKRAKWHCAETCATAAFGNVIGDPCAVPRYSFTPHISAKRSSVAFTRPATTWRVRR